MLELSGWFLAVDTSVRGLQSMRVARRRGRLSCDTQDALAQGEALQRLVHAACR
jgi:hypothetical protein